MSKIKFEEWIKQIVVIIDTREKEIDHIINVFKVMGVKYKFDKLESGDYTYFFINNDMSTVHGNILVERKRNLNELAINFTTGRTRFKNEFERIENVDLHLLIEDSKVLDNIHEQKYRSEIHPNSFIASLLSFQMKYGIKCHSISKYYTALYMLRLFYYNYYYLSCKMYKTII